MRDERRETKPGIASIVPVSAANGRQSSIMNTSKPRGGERRM